MKIKYFVAWLIPLLLLSCSSSYDDSKIKGELSSTSDRVAQLEKQVQSINSSIITLVDIVMALQQNVCVSQASQVDGDWVLTMTDGSTITIPTPRDGQNGQDGKDAPCLGIDIYEGIYYWTITINGNTSWLLDSLGKKIRVAGIDGTEGIGGVGGNPGKDGVTPRLKVDEYGYWIVSYDNGITYTRLLDKDGNSIYALGSSSDNSGDSVFVDVEVNSDSIVLSLKNGGSVKIPKVKLHALIFNQQFDIEVPTNGTLDIPFSVTGADASTFVECCSHGNVKARINYKRGDLDGTISVRTTGIVNTKSKILVFLCTTQETITYVLTFKAHDYTWTIPDDPGVPVPEPGNEPEEPNIPQPGGVDVTPDGSRNILSVMLTGIQREDGSWIDLVGTGDPKQNIWVAIDGISKGFIVEEVSEVESSAKADLIFLVDNSGTMSEESNVIARDISSWSTLLASNNLDIRFGLVGYDGCIHGAVNLTTASELNNYLNRSGVSGTSRTKGFAGADASALEAASKKYPQNCQEECGGAALMFADKLFNFRNGANRIYVNFTDEPNQPKGVSEYSVEYVHNQSNWPMGRGTIHTVFSENKSSCGKEYPWLFSDYTGGTTIFTNSAFTGVDLNTLPVSGALTRSVILRMVLPDSMLSGTHTLRIVIKDPYGQYYASKVFQNVTFYK